MIIIGLIRISNTIIKRIINKMSFSVFLIKTEVRKKDIIVKIPNENLLLMQRPWRLYKTKSAKSNNLFNLKKFLIKLELIS
jgi:hypothetical protein